MRKLIAAVVAALLCLSLFAGCGYNPDAVMTVDGAPVKAGRYLYYQFDSVYAAIETYGDTAVTGKAIYDVEIEGVPAREWIHNRTVEKCLESTYVDAEFERLELELDSFSEYYIEYQVSSSWNQYSAYYMQNGIGYETFLDMQREPYKKSLVIQTLYGADGEYAISDADKQAYFEANYARIDYIPFPTTDTAGSALGSEQLAKVGEVAALMAQATNDDELKALYLAHYADVYAQTTATTEVNEEGFTSLYLTDTLVSTGASGIDPHFVEAVLATTDNAFHLFEDEGAYYLYRRTILKAEDTVETYDLEIVTQLGTDPFQALMEQAIAGYDVVQDAKAQKYYSLDKVYLG